MHNVPRKKNPLPFVLMVCALALPLGWPLVLQVYRVLFASSALPLAGSGALTGVALTIGVVGFLALIGLGTLSSAHHQRVSAQRRLYEASLAAQYASPAFSRRRGCSPLIGLLLILLIVGGGVWMLSGSSLLALVGHVHLSLPASGELTSLIPSTASNKAAPIVRIDQLNPQQYASTEEYDTWADSTCSAAAMTEVMNAYGRHYRIADTLHIESKLGEITPQLGLQEDGGIAKTVAAFGFQTQWGYSRSLQQVLDSANKGTPVIVSFPPATWPGGHLLVVTGGDATTVSLADSSSQNLQRLPISRFLSLWRGFSAVVTPKGGQ